jgi:hypothetical protein
MMESLRMYEAIKLFPRYAELILRIIIWVGEYSSARAGLKTTNHLSQSWETGDE